jgi:hypothetical protein
MSTNFLEVRNGLSLPGSASAPGSSNAGDIYYDTTIGTLRAYQGGVWNNALGAPNQVVKNYLSNVVTSQSTTANTGNGSFENGTASGWSLAHSALTSFIPTSVASAGTPFDSSHGGSAASGNLTLTVNTGALAGTYNGQFINSAGYVAGDMMISSAFNIDTQDKAKMMQVQFYYSYLGPAAGNFSGTTSNTFAIYIYDVTNGAWIQPAGVYNIVQSSGAGRCTATFQTTSNSTQYQLAFLTINTTSGASTMNVSGFSVGPQTVSMGPAMSDWVAFTPTGSWVTNTTYTGQWRRVGGDMEIDYKVALTGAPNAVTLSFNLPSGYTIDTAKLASTVAAKSLGYGGIVAGGTFYRIDPLYGTTTSVTMWALSLNGSPFSFNIDATHPSTFGNGDSVQIRVQVPIVGWSSNTVQSSDTDTRVIKAKTASATTSVTSSASYTVMNLGSASYDTAGIVGSNLLTAPVSGLYDFTINGTCANASSGVMSVAYSINGVTEEELLRVPFSSITAQTFTTTTSFKLNAGDIFRVVAFQNSGSTQTLTFQATLTRNSGPAVVQATESVNARYTTAAGQSIANAATPQVNFDTKDFDSHNAVTTGASWKFTAPVSGKYRISTNVRYANTQNWALGSYVGAHIYKNGGDTVATDTAMQVAATSLATGPTALLSGTVSLLAGDYIDIRTAHGESTARSLVGASTLVWVSIERMGN